MFARPIVLARPCPSPSPIVMRRAHYSNDIATYFYYTDVLTTQVTEARRIHVFTAYQPDASSGFDPELSRTTAFHWIYASLSKPAARTSRPPRCLRQRPQIWKGAGYIHAFCHALLPTRLAARAHYVPQHVRCRARRRRELTPKAPQVRLAVAAAAPATASHMRAVGPSQGRRLARRSMETLPVISDTELCAYGKARKRVAVAVAATFNRGARPPFAIATLLWCRSLEAL
ncbi:hypothetical protein C2E23DRAFT_5357 [Lenzites betulinus]|nr:hypothetical protein C2E23DRAFT_5357 [Lenzites betulinus]